MNKPEETKPRPKPKLKDDKWRVKRGWHPTHCRVCGREGLPSQMGAECTWHYHGHRCTGLSGERD